MEIFGNYYNVSIRYIKSYVRLLPKLCIFFDILLLSIYFMCLFTDAQKYITLAINKILSPDIKPYLWTILTSGLCEINIISTLIHIFIINWALCKLELIWSAKSVITLFIIVITLSNIITICIHIPMFILNFAGSNEIWYFEYYSLHQITISLLIGIKQYYPESKLDLLSKIHENSYKFSLKYSPQLYCLFYLIYNFLFKGTLCFQIFFSFYISWWYLRFFMKNETNGIKGDRSSLFYFASFFPVFSQRFINKISENVYKFGLLIDLIPRNDFRHRESDIDKSNPKAKLKSKTLEGDIDNFLPQIPTPVKNMDIIIQKVENVLDDIDCELKPIQTKNN